MWDNNDYSIIAENGGGYMDGTKGSPGTGKKDGQVKRAQSVTPVVIGMLKNCTSDEFKLWGLPTHVLKLVGIMRKFDVTSTKITYEIEDHTGKIQAILWLEQDIKDQNDIPVDKENSYVRLFGTMRTQREGKVIMILRIAPIDFMNEITTHLLEVIHARYAAEKMFRGESISIRQNNPGADLSHSMMTFASGGAGQNSEEENMTALQKKVFRHIKSCTSKIGASRDDIQGEFPHVPRKDLWETLEFLSSEGHVFTTVDNDHFKHTD